jgi:transketolase
VIYDDNHISIEDDTNIAFSEDVAQALRGLRLARADVDWRDSRGRRRPRRRWRRDRGARPSPTGRRSSRMRTIIGWPAPTKQNTGKAHGSRARRRRGRGKTKEMLGFDPDAVFEVDDEVLAHAREVVDRGRALRARAWGRRVRRLAAANPTARRCSTGSHAGSCPTARRRLPVFPADAKGSPPARRRGKVLTRWPPCCPSCGAARPTWPRATTRRWRASRASSPSGTADQDWKGGPVRPHLHFGIREHAMGAILNGIALHGG